MAVKIGQLDSKELFTIPNLITYFRILCVPVFCVLMGIGGVRDNINFFYAAFGVFLLASGSDLIDGWIARKFNMQSGVGMALDPIADKLMHISVLFCLSLCTGLTPLGQNMVGRSFIEGITVTNPWFVHYGFVIAIVAKELLQTVIAIYVMRKGATVKANWLGKVSSFTISIGVILGFFHQYVAYADWGILAWGIAMSYAAAANYGKQTFKAVKLIKEGKMEAATSEAVKAKDQANVAAGKGIEDLNVQSEDTNKD